MTLETSGQNHWDHKGHTLNYANDQRASKEVDNRGDLAEEYNYTPYGRQLAWRHTGHSDGNGDADVDSTDLTAYLAAAGKGREQYEPQASAYANTPRGLKPAAHRSAERPCGPCAGRPAPSNRTEWDRLPACQSRLALELVR